MSSLDLVRWGGLAALLSGMAFIVMGLLGLVLPEPSPGSFLDTVFVPLFSVGFIVALLLLLVGLAGFHALQKGNYGRIGRAGLYTVLVGASAQVLAQVGLMFGNTVLAPPNFVGLFLVVMVGLVLYGVATLQARVLPRWCGVGFIVGLPVWVAVSVIAEEYGGHLGEYCSGSFGWHWATYSGLKAARQLGFRETLRSDNSFS